MKEFNKDMSIHERANNQTLYKFNEVKYRSLEMINNCYKNLTRLIKKQKRKYKLPISGMK